MRCLLVEKLEQIRQTLGEIDAGVPNALRVALGLGNRLSPTPAPGEDDEVADFAASLLQPPATTEDGARADADDLAPTEPDTAASSALTIDLASCYVPLHDHDAHFGNATAGVLGVADGVGAYADDGVDAGAFSRGLMASASAEVAGLEPGGAHVSPCALLKRAYVETAASGAPGASTADIIAGLAYKRSNQTSSRRLRKGKPDDITVLVAFIVQPDS